MVYSHRTNRLVVAGLIVVVIVETLYILTGHNIQGQKELEAVEENNIQGQKELEAVEENNIQGQKELEAVEENNIQGQKELEAVEENNIQGQKELEAVEQNNIQGQKELKAFEKNIIFKTPIRGENNIFFLETKCALRDSTESPPQVRLTVQSSCAIESASRANPSASIYLYHSCPLDEGSLSRSSQFARETLALPNVFIWYQNVSSMFKDTALEELYQAGNLTASTSPTEHASDVLRVLTLLKYGGVYLDMDFIITKNFGDLPPNWACHEVGIWMGNSAMGMSVDSVGTMFAEKVVEELRTDFRGDQWAYNGPAAVSRVLHKICNYTDVDKMIANANDSNNCRGFVALHSKVFFPIMYSWESFYDEAKSDEVMKKIEEAHGVHLWNAIKSDKNYKPESAQAMVLMRKQSCPVTYKVSFPGSR